MKKILLNFILLLLAGAAGAQIIVSGEITSNTNWNNNNIYIISGWLYVRDGATLTIEPGTVIKGDFATQGALIIERGGKIIADGTAEQPIVFTSQKAPGERFYGDWGGVILCGKASINVPENIGNGTVAGENIIEGGVGSKYGGGANPDDNDNSGILRYVRIEFGGIAFQPNNEINGLTCGGVGRGTTIDHVQVSYSGDDAFEFFGGTVNCTNLIAYRNWDDDFDTDFGYRGKVQFAMSVRDPAIADQSGSNGFESDNDAQGTTNSPYTNPVFSNVTIIGPYANNATINSNYKRGAHIRRNSRCSIFNSVVAGYPTGLLLDGTLTQSAAANNDLRIQNTAWVAMDDSLATTTSVNPNNVSGTFNIDSWFFTAGYDNSLISGISELMLQDISLSHPVLTLMDGSPLSSGANFTDSYLDDAFFTPTTYRGAFGVDNWTACWSEWAPQNESYNGAIDNSITAGINVNGISTVCVGESVILTANTNAEGAAYTWSNNQSTGEIEVTAPSSIFLTVTDENGCVAVSEPIELSVFPEPAVAITADGPTSFCTGGSVNLSSSHATGNEWSNDATGQMITVTATGTYDLTYTDANGCEAVSNTISVSVSDSPAPTITTNGALSFCEGESVVLTASPSDSYQWYLNGQELNTATSQTLSATQAGVYYVAVTNADQCDGVGNSVNVFVVVNPQPEAGFDYEASFGSYVYEFNNNSINSTSYSWNFGDGGSSEEANPAHTFTTAGSHTVTLTATNGDCVDVYEVTISDVSVSENEYVETLSLYPNPASGDTRLSVILKNNNDVRVEIYDLAGKVVFSKTEVNVFGQQVIMLLSSALDSGIYFVGVRIGTSSEMLRLVVNR